jgi:hypothetical protein
LLSEANVPLPTVQQIMRHSTPALTAKHYVRLSVVDKARALEKLPDFHPDKSDSESMKATGTDGRNAPESVDTKFDTNRDDKGLFQAMSSYNADIINIADFDGSETKEPLTSQGDKGFSVYGAGEPSPFEGKQALLIRWRMQGREFIEVKDVQ